MRVLHLLLSSFILMIQLISYPEARSIASTALLTTSTQPQMSKTDSIRYKISDSSSQIEVLDEGDEDEQEDESFEGTTEKTTVDPSFSQLSRQAFDRLRVDQQSIKPVIEADENRRLLWLADHQRRRENKKGGHHFSTKISPHNTRQKASLTRV